MKSEQLKREAAIKAVDDKLTAMIEQIKTGLESKLGGEIQTLKSSLDLKIATVDQLLSTVEVRVGVVEELVKALPTKQQVTT